jgi:tetratricopeptide (TPR) repeat protein
MASDEEITREKAMVLFDQAYRRQMDGELGEAIVLYKQSIATYPTAEAYTFLGWTYSLMGRIAEAVKMCEKAIEVDPTYGNPYNDIGAYLLRQERVDEAIPWFQRALEAPRYESYCFPHMNLGRAWEAKRLWRRALAEYRKALVARPEYRPAREAAVRILGLLN